MKILATPKQRRTGNVRTLADDQDVRVMSVDYNGNMILCVASELLVLNGRYDFLVELRREEFDRLSRISIEAQIKHLKKRIFELERLTNSGQ